MERRELISIIIPVYRVEQYLNKCVQSVVSQTYKNLEIILVDDGSPDKCPAICDEWANKDSRIKVIHKENGGLSDARNAGLAIAKGKYIGFVDSDDYIEETMYELLYTAIKNEDADLAICNLEKVTEAGEPLSAGSYVKREVFSKEEGLYKILDANNWSYVTAWNKLYKREIWDGIEFPKGKIHEDQFVIHRIIFQCQKIVAIEDKLYKYVQRSGSIMTGTIGVKCLDEIEAFCQRAQFYIEHEFTYLYPCIASSLKERYRSQRFRMNKVTNRNDKKRIHKIDKMFRKYYFECSESVSLKEKLMYRFPTVWLYVRKIVKKLNRLLK